MTPAAQAAGRSRTWPELLAFAEQLLDSDATVPGPAGPDGRCSRAVALLARWALEAAVDDVLPPGALVLATVPGRSRRAQLHHHLGDELLAARADRVWTALARASTRSPSPPPSSDDLATWLGTVRRIALALASAPAAPAARGRR